MEADATSALSLINLVSSGGDPKLEVKRNNVKQLVCLTNHFAYKIRAATFKKANQTANARDAMGKAYCWWMNYVTLMGSMYTGNDFRTVKFDDWSFGNQSQLQDYQSLGGSGTPNCDQVGINKQPLIPQPQAMAAPRVLAVTASGITLTLPADGECTISLFNSAGKQVQRSYSFMGKKGTNNFNFERKIGHGIYFIRINAGNSSLGVRKAVTI